ncbi:SIS domain-containing protein [Corynebacterium sp. CCM 9185]|uniref:SIS domain-containing protein n=1 Tax=Corynebacterium marambiense TaxID=2765364 RepID=A0ABS0W0W3_9CORY|nr:SIS domain-containing protein [Corynebacterium marambiense]MBI9001227.1 SIS domain-containing protein [Corynebacterium marambiense]MCK7663784.1 SIS domain-containing protein [Corynebacterium marambiense]MCX7542932.1 SIS domain-containing protein [Corynebacterium marambiense]
MSSALGTHMEQELTSQPDTWQKALDMEQERSVLPKSGERVAVVGCGTSWFMAQSYAALRESAGHGVTDAYTATEARLDREYDVLIAITRSGTTSEIIDLLKQVGDRMRTIAVLGDQNSPVAELADHVINLEFADEQSVVQTRFATTALTFLRASIDDRSVIERSIAQAREVLAADLDEKLVNAEQYSFLGTDWRLGLATEAALKMRESCQAWTESYSSMEYRHGPIAIASEGRITWNFGPAPEGLAAQVADTGATFIDEDIDPMADLVRVHRIALATARARGLDADHPRNLTRSVILK